MRKINLPPFSTAAFCDELRAAGVALSLQPDGPRVRWGSDVVVTPALIEEVKSRRAELIELLSAEREEVTPLLLGPARELLARLRAAGLTVSLADGRVRVQGPAPDEQTCARIRELKPAIVRVLSQEQGAEGGA